MYKIVYLDSVESDLKKLDKKLIIKLLNRIDNYLAKDPIGLGKALTGKYLGYWRYRYGDYRIIYKIAGDEILVIVAKIGHP